MPDAVSQPEIIPAIHLSTGADGKPLVAVTGAGNLRSLTPVLRELTLRLQGCAADAAWDL